MFLQISGPLSTGRLLGRNKIFQTPNLAMDLTLDGREASNQSKKSLFLTNWISFVGRSLTSSLSRFEPKQNKLFLECDREMKRIPIQLSRRPNIVAARGAFSAEIFCGLGSLGAGGIFLAPSGHMGPAAANM